MVCVQCLNRISGSSIHHTKSGNGPLCPECCYYYDVQEEEYAKHLQEEEAKRLEETGKEVQGD